MTTVDSFSVRILSAPSWEEASDIYMEARSALCRDGAEWGRCVEAMARQEAPKEQIKPMIFFG